jgi:hypothetical protein
MQELMPNLKAPDLPVSIMGSNASPKSEAYEIGILRDFTANILEVAWNNLHESKVLERFRDYY